MFYGITLILLSMIAVPSLILSKKPNAKELLAKVEPFQGWIGLLFCLFGVWGIISCILNLGWLASAPIWWITLLTGSIVEAILGFMLGFSLLNRLVLNQNASAKEKAVQLHEKIAPKQGFLGMLGIVVGIWMIVGSFLFAVV